MSLDDFWEILKKKKYQISTCALENKTLGKNSALPWHQNQTYAFQKKIKNKNKTGDNYFSKIQTWNLL